MPRTANPTLREDILRAALQLVEAEGTAGLSMRKIAGALGYSATAVYQHFRSKDELVFTLMVQAADLLTAEMEIARREPSLQAQLLAMGRRYVQFGLSNPAYYRLIFHGSAIDGSDMPERLTRMRRSWSIMRDALHAWVLEQKLQDVDSEREANILWMIVHGLTSLTLAGRLSFHQRDDIFALFDLAASRWAGGLLSTRSASATATGQAHSEHRVQRRRRKAATQVRRNTR